MSKKKLNENKGGHPIFVGLEIGAVSTKWVERDESGKTDAKVMRHEGNPTKKVTEILNSYSDDTKKHIVVTGQASRALFDLPYRAETECLEKAMEFYNLTPDILY